MMSDVASDDDGYPALIAATREFLDRLAGARPGVALLRSLTEDLQRWSRELAGVAVEEEEQPFGRRPDDANRGECMTPSFDVRHMDHQSLSGTVTFGRYFLGRNGAAHGGAITLLFDDVIGRLANHAVELKFRTAYLNTNFRSLTPIDTALDVRTWVTREEGRKRFLRGEIWHGKTLCAEAEGLFIELKPGQR